MIHLHPRPAAQRGNLQKWLRRIHAWFGLAIASMLLLFAVTGFLLNHRAVMKIPALDRKEVMQILPLEAGPADPQALAAEAHAAREHQARPHRHARLVCGVGTDFSCNAANRRPDRTKT